MNMRKLSINKACVLLGTLLLLSVGAVCAAVYLLTQNITCLLYTSPEHTLRSTGNLHFCRRPVLLWRKTLMNTLAFTLGEHRSQLTLKIRMP